MDNWVVGIDLGGTKIEVGLVAPDNRIVARKRFPTDDHLTFVWGTDPRPQPVAVAPDGSVQVTMPAVKR